MWNGSTSGTAPQSVSHPSYAASSDGRVESDVRVLKAPRGGLPNDQFGLDGDLLDVVCALLKLIEQGSRCELTHFLHWLANGREARHGIGSAWNVVKSHYRDVLRDSQTGFIKRSNRTNRAQIVVGKKGSKAARLRKKFLGSLIAGLRRCADFRLVEQTDSPISIPNSPETSQIACHRASVSALDGGPFMNAKRLCPKSTK